MRTRKSGCRLRRTSTEPRRAGKRGKADPVDVPGGLCTDECTRNRPRQPGHNYAPFFLPQLAAGKDRHTMAQLAARGTPRRHPTIWELYLPRVRQRVSLAEPARAKGARRLQISGAVCCIAGPGRTGAFGCKTRVRHHGTENRRCGKIAMRRAAKTATPGKRESLTNFESKMLSLALPGGYFLIITARRDVSTLDT